MLCGPFWTLPRPKRPATPGIPPRWTLAGKLERAKSNLAAFDGLDSLERSFLPPGTPPPSRTPELKSAAPPSGSWTEN